MTRFFSSLSSSIFLNNAVIIINCFHSQPSHTTHSVLYCDWFVEDGDGIPESKFELWKLGKYCYPPIGSFLNGGQLLLGVGLPVQLFGLPSPKVLLVIDGVQPLLRDFFDGFQLLCFVFRWLGWVLYWGLLRYWKRPLNNPLLQIHLLIKEFLVGEEPIEWVPNILNPPTSTFILSTTTLSCRYLFYIFSLAANFALIDYSNSLMLSSHIPMEFSNILISCLVLSSF